MISALFIIACIFGLLILAGLVVGIVIIMESGERDVVSTARQGWIFRRSEQDQDGW